jgi:hypothetical protein
MTRPLHENAPHGERSGRKEMTTSFPLPGLARNAQVRLVNKCGRLECLVRLSLACESRSRELPKFVIHFWQQLARRGRPAGIARVGCHRAPSL